MAPTCWYFTATTRERWPAFRDPYKVRAFVAAMHSVCERDGLENLALVVLPDHVHGLWSLPDDDFARRWDALRETLDATLRWASFAQPPRTHRLTSELERIKLSAY